MTCSCCCNTWISIMWSICTRWKCNIRSSPINFYSLIRCTFYEIIRFIIDYTSISISCWSCCCCIYIIIICMRYISYTTRTTSITTFSCYCSWFICPSTTSSAYCTFWCLIICLNSLICWTSYRVSCVVSKWTTISISCCTSWTCIYLNWISMTKWWSSTSTS